MYYNSFINYYLLDYIVHVAYYSVFEFKDKITNLPYLNCSPFSLKRAINNKYNQSKICLFNKLSRKIKYYFFHNKTATNYKYIIDHYKFNFDNIHNNIILNI